MNKKVKISDVCDILNGYAFKSQNYVKEGIRVIRITNVQKGYIEDRSPEYYPLSSIDEIGKYVLKENDLLVSLTGNVGRVAVLSSGFLPAALNQRVACVRIKDEKKLNKMYLFSILNSDLFERACIYSAQGIAQKNMSTEWLKKFEIELPPIEEQKKIAEILDKASNLISFRKKQIEKLDLLVKSRFIEMFGDPALNPKCWIISNYEDICSLITDGEHATPKRCEEGIYLLSARNVFMHSLQLEDVDYIDKDEYIRISKRIVPEEDDILISCSGSVGRACKVPPNLKFQMVRSVAILRFKDNINTTFMEWLIDSKYTQQQILKSINQSSQANLFQGKIKQLKAIVPPIDLQNQFASFVNQVDKLKFELQQCLEKMDLNYKALMQKYFG